MYSGAGSVFTLPEAPGFTPRFFVGFVLLDLSFMCMFCRSLFVLFVLVIVLSVLLRYTDSDYLPLVSSNSYYMYMYLCQVDCDV